MLWQGRIQDFKLGGGGALEKIAPSGRRPLPNVSVSTVDRVLNSTWVDL